MQMFPLSGNSFGFHLIIRNNRRYRFSQDMQSDEAVSGKYHWSARQKVLPLPITLNPINGRFPKLYLDGQEAGQAVLDTVTRVLV